MPLAKVNRGIIYGQIEAEGDTHAGVQIDVPAYVEDAETYEARLHLLVGLKDDNEVLSQLLLDERSVERHLDTAEHVAYVDNLKREVHRLQGLHKKNGRLHEQLKELSERAGHMPTVEAAFAEVASSRQRAQVAEAALYQLQLQRQMEVMCGPALNIEVPAGLKVRRDGARYIVDVDSLVVLGAEEARKVRERTIPPVVAERSEGEAESFYRRWEGTAGVTPRYRSWPGMGRSELKAA